MLNMTKLIVPLFVVVKQDHKLIDFSFPGIEMQLILQLWITIFYSLQSSFQVIVFKQSCILHGLKVSAVLLNSWKWT